MDGRMMMMQQQQHMQQQQQQQMQQQQQQQQQQQMQMIALQSMMSGGMVPFPMNPQPVSEMSQRQGAADKRSGGVKREPTRAQFSSDTEYMHAWVKWRAARNNNNLAVSKCRSKAKKKKPFLQKTATMDPKQQLADIQYLLDIVKRNGLNRLDDDVLTKVQMMRERYLDIQPKSSSDEGNASDSSYMSSGNHATPSRS